ncbi:MAG: hypothetical protein JSS74_12460 [Actinobacteria bacterium]|nr:hypothetical protein [Actinomycetota bacterium]
MSKRARTQGDPSPLLVMVRVVVADNGTLIVTVDGHPYLPPEFSPPWQRSSYPAIVDAICIQYGRTLRIDVVETDGHRITDFYTPPRPRPTQVPPVREARPEHASTTPAAEPPRIVQLSGSGFVPGEHVAVAVIIAHTDASPEGGTRAVLDARALAQSPTGEVVLPGRISGTITIGSPA